MFFPQVANILPDSSFGKFVVFGVFLAGVPLTIVAAIRGRRRRLSRKSQKENRYKHIQAPFMGAAITKEKSISGKCSASRKMTWVGNATKYTE